MFVSVNPTGGTSNTSGIYAWDGTPQTARHLGPYVNINDNCAGAPGTGSSDGSGNIAFGEILVPNAPGDCQDQNGINDNSPAARQFRMSTSIPSRNGHWRHIRGFTLWILHKPSQKRQ